MEELTAASVYKTTVGNDEVVIGKEGIGFSPQIQFTRWNKECSLTIDAGKLLVNAASGTIQSSSSAIEFHDADTGWYVDDTDKAEERIKFGLKLYLNAPQLNPGILY